MDFLLGIDAGTSGYAPLATQYPQPGWAVQNPQDWYDSIVRATRECLQSGGLDGKDILALDGPAHSAALLDGRGHVIYPTIHTSDLRSASQAMELQERMGDRIQPITFQRPNPSWTLSHLAWLKQNEREVFSHLRKVLVVKDYLRARLTSDYFTDAYDAIGTQMYDILKDDWSEELCLAAGWQASRMPEVRPANSIAGGLLPEASRDLRLLVLRRQSSVFS